MQWILILLSLSVLGAIAISFKFANLSGLDTMNDRLTGYPTWAVIINKHPVIFTWLILFVFSFFLLLGADPNRIDAANLSAIVGILVAGIIGLKTIRNATKRSKLITHIFLVSGDSDRDPTGTPAYGLELLNSLGHIIHFNCFYGH